MRKWFIIIALIIADAFVINSDMELSALSRWVPNGAVQYDSIPTVYYFWWKEITDCAHGQSDFQKIHWWKVPGTSFQCLGGRCWGWWSGSNHNIFIAEGQKYNRQTVEHEMLHDILGRKNPRDLGQHHQLFITCNVL